MRISILTLTVAVCLNLITDWYIYKCLLTGLKNKIWAKIQFWSAIILNLGLISFFFLPLQSASDSILRGLSWTIFLYISIYVPKYIFVVFNLIASIPRLWHRGRIKAVTWTGVIISLIVFFSLWWGALYNRFNLNVNEVDVPISSLPESFDGFRIAQISDLHVGTYGNDTTFIHNLVTEINSLNSDVILFTGDIVNRQTKELVPFTKTLAGLKAKYGIFSILGNHDYGDYYKWPNDSAHAENNLFLARLQSEMGWKLLANNHDYIKIGSDSLVIIGVENIGDPPFHRYGDLKLAYPTPTDSLPKILMSHNPAHWTSEIAESDYNIDLTLSGHTHAMQITLFGWSPSSWRYPTWGGLYKDSKNKHHLYVNIGTGTVGFPARVGATPEITLITLRKR